MNTQLWNLLRICIASVLFVSAANADGDAVNTLLQNYCVDCHSGDGAEADFSLTKLLENRGDRLEANLAAPQIAQWEQVFQRVASGEMPPEDAEQPEPETAKRFLKTLRKQLADADRRRQLTEGRGVLRRLNRVEFEHSLSDLLEVPLHIRELLPEDARGDGFDTVGEALNVSSVQIEAYLQAIDEALDQATSLIKRPERRKYRLDYRQTRGMMMVYRGYGPHVPVEDGLAMFAPDYHSHFNSLLDHYVVAHSARYRVRVSAYALRSDDPITLTVRMGGPGHLESDAERRTLLGNVSVYPGEPQVFEFEEYLQRGQMFRIYPSSLRKMRFTAPRHRAKQQDYEGPAVVVRWVEVDGPIYESWPPPAHKRLYDGIPIKPIPRAKPNRNPNAHLDSPPPNIAKPRLTKLKERDKKTGFTEYYDPKQEIGGEPIYPQTLIRGPLHPTMQLAPKNPKRDAERLLLSFAQAAMREPVAKERIQPTVDIVQDWLDEGVDFEQAMRVGYQSLLVSTDFLYHQARHAEHASNQATGVARGNRLNQRQLSERLSYFLWNSIPDSQLRDLASSGKLDSPESLQQQVDRMLADPKAERFISGFLEQWLDLRQIDFTSPDADLYPEFDPLLKWSMVEESKAFFRELINSDLPVTNVIDSDFAMLNDRLAKHYNVDGVNGIDLRKVSLPEDSVRGGFLTQASVLKVTANGTTTSPVVRGVWIMDRILGVRPSPPPPGIPAIEPDIRGAVTIREQLDKHRSVESCASCHKKIDPLGVALENFDVIGGYRDRYRVIVRDDTGRKPTYHPDSPPPIVYEEGPDVDASDVLPDGRKFSDIRGLKRALTSDPDAVARAVAEKLIVYATGAPTTFADHEELHEIVEHSRQTSHGLRSLIHHVVQSRFFHER